MEKGFRGKPSVEIDDAGWRHETRFPEFGQGATRRLNGRSHPAVPQGPSEGATPGRFRKYEVESAATSPKSTSVTILPPTPG